MSSSSGVHQPLLRFNRPFPVPTTPFSALIIVVDLACQPVMVLTTAFLRLYRVNPFPSDLPRSFLRPAHPADSAHLPCSAAEEYLAHDNSDNAISKPILVFFFPLYFVAEYFPHLLVPRVSLQ